MITQSQILALNSRQSIEEFIDRGYDGSVDDFIDEVSRGFTDLLRTDLKKAGLYLDSVSAIFTYLPSRFKPRLHAMRGRYNYWCGNYSDALKFYLTALRLYRRAGNAGDAARLGKGLLNVYMSLGRYQKALTICKKSLAYFRRKKMFADVGHVLINMGNIYHRMDNNRMALSYYNKAKMIAEKDDDVILAIINFNLGNIYSNLNQFGKAKRLYVAAAEMYQRSGMEIAENQARYSLAYLYFLEDRFTKAIKIFEEVYENFTRLGDSRTAAITQLDMSELNIQLNQYGSAIMIADRIIPELHRLGMRYEEAKAYYFGADARLRLGDYQEAAKQLKKAASLFTREKNMLWLGMVFIAKSKLYAGQKRFKLAVKASSSAIEYFDKSGDERRKSDARISQIEAVFKSGDFDKALKSAQMLKRKKLVSYQIYNLNGLIGNCLFELKNYAEALKYYKAAVGVIEKMLSGLFPDEIRYFFIVDKYESYKMMVECLLHLGKIHDSFLTNLKALELINRPIAAGHKLSAELPSELIETRNTLRAALKKLNRPAESIRAVAETSSYYSLEQKLWSNERKIRSIIYHDEFGKQETSVDATPYCDVIKPDETIVNYFASDNLIGAYCVNSGKETFVTFDTSLAEVHQILRKLHFLFETAVIGERDEESARSIINYYLTRLHKLIFKPLEKYILGKSIIIIADGMFGQIPFSALKDSNGQYLVDRYRLSSVVNPQDLINARRSSVKLKTGRCAIFANASEKLPSIEIEANQIRKLFKDSKLYINEQASCGNLSRELRKNNGFLHIAAHASRSSENPLFSRILLNDGPFFPFDLFESGVNAELVTLSGCQTAAPGLYYGNSFSLAKAFYHAGSRYVLASLWPVSDRLSMMFMTEFYKRLAASKRVCQTYIDTVGEVKKITENPAFWSAFILIGI